MYKLSCFLGLLIAVHATTVTLDNLKLYVDCEEFVIKAICYNPVPLGYLKMADDLTGGGGYCSPKMTPFGEWKSACYDSDYFDGSPDIPNRYPPGPAVGWFQAVWARDLPLIKELGANTVRLYNSNPTTRQATIEQAGTNGIVYPYGKDHIPFMDACATAGIKVIYPLVGDYTLMQTSSEDVYKQFLKNQIDEVGNHSALIMWNFSNELPLNGNPTLVNMLNNYIAFIKNYTMEKWNRFIPVTTAVVDIPTSYDTLMATLNVDVFSSNAGYRGLDFQDLWSGDRTPGFSGFFNLSKTYNKPLFISEIGWHTENNAITYSIPTWFNQIWKDLVAHIDQGCIGGAFFEYSDEPGKKDTLQQTMGLVNFTVAMNQEGQKSDDVNVFLTDTVTKKDIIFEAVKSGTFNNTAYNFNADVFTLIGRPQTTLDHSKCVPTTQPSGTGTTSTNTNTNSTQTSTVPSSSSTGTIDATTDDANPDSSAASFAVISWMTLALYVILTAL